MSQQNTDTANAQQARTVAAVDHGKLDLKALTLYAILLAAGFVLNLTVSKFFSGLTGGFLSPEFIICAVIEVIIAVSSAVAYRIHRKKQGKISGEGQE